MIDETTNAPEWRDAPTCAGWWIFKNYGHRSCGNITEAQVIKGGWRKGSRWFGPIPADTNKVVTDAIESIRPVVEEAFRNA